MAYCIIGERSRFWVGVYIFEASDSTGCLTRSTGSIRLFGWGHCTYCGPYSINSQCIGSGVVERRLRGKRNEEVGRRNWEGASLQGLQEKEHRRPDPKGIWRIQSRESNQIHYSRKPVLLRLYLSIILFVFHPETTGTRNFPEIYWYSIAKCGD